MVSSASEGVSAATLTTLAGVVTPLGDLSVTIKGSGSVLAIVTAQTGTLTADFSSGATVRGNGTGTLWISGASDQVNAKLAKLSYFGAAAGRDDVSVVLIGPQAASAIAIDYPLTISPLQGPVDPVNSTIAIGQGTLTLEARTIDGPVIALTEIAGSDVATTAILVNSTIGHSSVLAIANNNAVGGLAPRLAIAGRVELDGTLGLSGNGTTITLAAGATLDNQGTISIDAHAALFTGTGALRNDGLLRISGDGSALAPVQINTSIDGSGRILLDGSATLAVGAAVGSGETVELGAGANTLHVSQLAGFGATVAGFTLGDRIVLDGISVTGAQYSASADTGTGTLTVLNDQAVAGAIRFSAPETGTVFELGHDTNGNAVISLQPVGTSAASKTVDVFRFFDSRTGTQLLTQDAAERDSIIGSRPDLYYEGVGLHAISRDQNGTNTAAIYRFFDTNNGSHFMTANSGERDTLLATRPDLVFEPGGTIFEHATAEAGDVPVYRFFDAANGAHFFTANAGERATILSTRADMVSEGIAFYAPS